MDLRSSKMEKLIKKYRCREYSCYPTLIKIDGRILLDERSVQGETALELADTTEWISEQWYQLASELGYSKSNDREEKPLKDNFPEVAVGDAVLTTSGFYGFIRDVVDDVVIVEFGNNKNCRIPMSITAIAEVEKLV